MPPELPSRDGYGTIRTPLVCQRCGDDIEKATLLAQRSPRYKGRRLPTRRNASDAPKSLNWSLIMKVVGYSTVFTAFAVLAFGLTSSSEAADLPPVDSAKLQSLIVGNELVEKGETLLGFAYESPTRNRVIGSPGHNATVNYLANSLRDLGDYYTVEVQPFEALYSGGSAQLTVENESQGASLMTYSPSGTVTETLAAVANLGCNATDYGPDVSGHIALISHGSCQFGLKSSLAGAAGAIAAVIYNNVEGQLSGTLGPPPRPEGPYVPTAGISLANGTDLLARLTSGPVSASLIVDSIIENRTTYNVLATTNSGDQSNVYQLGAHTDSVDAGPGINDDGSGTIGLLEIATQLSGYSVTNAVRFSFWAGEEEGLLGSNYYTSTLPAAELAKIRLYLNFDMIASPNYIYGIYDGDGSALNVSAPPGSGFAEQKFIDYYTSRGLPTVPVDFDGRSDYQGFFDAGIPTGGVFTGAEVLKTEAEAALFGGEVGVAHDVNYHGPGDTVANCNVSAWVINTQAIADSVARYGTSFEGIPVRTNDTVSRVGRGLGKRTKLPAAKRAFRHTPNTIAK